MALVNGIGDFRQQYLRWLAVGGVRAKSRVRVCGITNDYQNRVRMDHAIRGSTRNATGICVTLYWIINDLSELTM